MNSSRNLGSPSLWNQSLRASFDRRASANRARRWSRRRRLTVTTAAVSMIALGGSAIAAPATSTKATSSSVSVRYIQKKLGVAVDGIAGPQTRAAIKNFQRANGLAVDGIVGPQTLAALKGSKAKTANSAGLSTASANVKATTTTASSKAATPSSSIPASAQAILNKIAKCESGGDPTAVDPSGTYRGKYQFDRSTWASMGGSGDPAAASEATQDRLAYKLYKARGASPWPVCGR